MYRTFYLFALLLFISSLSLAQPEITLSKTVGTGGTESIHDMIADHDGHLIALGQCDSVDRDTSCHYHGGSSDIWLVKMDAEGNTLHLNISQLPAATYLIGITNGLRISSISKIVLIK
ncbi:MAG: hypothetical protein JST18_03995 [Bacteroidetes bacterium]|nr:hypothetical protein [Bacteroidota bacterium]